MLVLTRKVGQDVHLFIGDNPTPITVMKVTQIRGDQVKISFEAPDAIKILRGEVLRRQQEGGVTTAT